MIHFLLLCALLSWPFQIAAIYVPGLALPLHALGGLGPTLAATIVTRGAVWRTLRERAPLGQVALALLGPTALVALAAGVDLALGGIMVVVMPFIGSLVLPPIGEELGWRGYMQPELARTRRPLVAALAVGVAWTTWHVVPALVAGADALVVGYFAASLIAWSLIAAWLGRVWLAIALHVGINAAAMVVPDDTPRAAVLRIGVIVIAGLLAAQALAKREHRA